MKTKISKNVKNITYYILAAYMPSSKFNRRKQKKTNYNNLYISLGVIVCLIACGMYFGNETKKTPEQPEIIKPEPKPLEDPDRLESFELQIKKQEMLNRFNRGDLDFTEEELLWFEKTEDPVMNLGIAGIYKGRNEISKAIDKLEKVIQVHYDLHANAHSQAFNMLSGLYASQGRSKSDDFERVLIKALKTRQSDDYASLWYGKLGMHLIQRLKYDEAREILLECVKEFETIENESPHPCLHQLGLIEATKEMNLDEAMKYWIDLYESQFKYWYDEKHNKRIVKYFPIGINGNFYNFTKSHDYSILYNRLQISDVYSDFPEILKSSYPCTEQEYAYRMEAIISLSMNNNKIFKMKCFSNEERYPSIFKFKDVEISLPSKHIFHDTHFGYYYFYAIDFPYKSSLSYPIIRSKVRALPEFHVENALIISLNEESYYFFTIHGISRLLIALNHPILSNIKDLKIIVTKTDHITSIFSTLNISSKLLPYEHEKYRYRVQNLYTIEWLFSTSALQNYKTYIEDYFVPPTSVLQYTRSKMLSLIPNPNPRNAVIFLHRAGRRRVIDSEPLFKVLQNVCNDFNVEFIIHDEKSSLIEQQKLFQRAIVVIGIDGGGFANLIYCKENTGVIEIPTFPLRASEAQRLSAIFNFSYYRTKGGLYSSFYSASKYTDDTIKSSEETLRGLLPAVKIKK